MQLEIRNMTGYNLTESQKDLICKTADITLGLDSYKLNNYETEACLSIVDNDEIRRLNEKFRRIDAVTDVLSFPLLDFSDELSFDGIVELGDIIISIERAEQQAQEYGHSLERELCFLTAHSILHLLGYDHKEALQEAEMCRLQEEALSQLNLFR